MELGKLNTTYQQDRPDILHVRPILSKGSIHEIAAVLNCALFHLSRAKDNELLRL